MKSDERRALQCELASLVTYARRVMAAEGPIPAEDVEALARHLHGSALALSALPRTTVSQAKEGVTVALAGLYEVEKEEEKR